MGDSTDAADTAQLAIFIRGIDDEYNVTEEVASLVPLKGTTKSRDLYEAVKKKVKAIFFVHCQHIWHSYWPCPGSGREKRGTCRSNRRRCNCHPKLTFGDVSLQVHRGNLCTKALKMHNVMQITITTVNFIGAKGWNHHQFQEFCKSI